MASISSPTGSLQLRDKRLTAKTTAKAWHQAQVRCGSISSTARQPVDALPDRLLTASIGQHPVNRVECRVAEARTGVDRYQSVHAPQDVPWVQIAARGHDDAGPR